MMTSARYWSQGRGGPPDDARSALPATGGILWPPSGLPQGSWSTFFSLNKIVSFMKVEPLFCTWIKNHIPNWEEVFSLKIRFIFCWTLSPIGNEISLSCDVWFPWFWWRTVEKFTLLSNSFLISRWTCWICLKFLSFQCIVVSPDEGGAKRCVRTSLAIINPAHPPHLPLSGPILWL